jgi:hypothetical protein
MTFNTGATPTEYMRITCGGNIGICNANPLSPLSFANTVGNKIDFYNDGSSRYTAQINSNELRFYNTSTNDVISLYANNTVGLVNKNGQVAIAHTSPVDVLDVMGAFRVRCNTPNFTATCNSLVIDYVNTSIFGSSPMARYYSIGCTGVSAGHKFLVGQPNSGFDAFKWESVLRVSAGAYGTYGVLEVLPDKIGRFLFEYYSDLYQSLGLPALPEDRSGVDVHRLLQPREVCKLTYCCIYSYIAYTVFSVYFVLSCSAS